MSDLIDDPRPGNNAPEFTVAEIAGRVKKLIEGELGWVRVRGEVGRVVLARSGHLYFDLKDDRNVLSCMTWKGQVPGIGVMPEEGMEVVAEGRMTASGFQSKFSLNAQHVAVAGEGALMALLEKRKKALAAEGLFDDARKRPLPYLPEIIGVVTSLQGVVIRDILHRLRDRFPRKVLVWPVAVQGEKCAPEVAKAIEGFNALSPGGALPRPDLIIVARGGGSIEDLWGFNEEIVARAAAASDIPLMSAVGHETDTTLIDYASDKRAPTPTAAAEMAVPVRLELLAWVEAQGARLSAALSGGVERRGQRLRDLARTLPRARSLLDAPSQKLDVVGAQLDGALIKGVQRRRVALSEASGALRPSALRQKLAHGRERTGAQANRLAPALMRGVEQRRERLDGLAARLGRSAPQTGLLQRREAFDRAVLRLSDVGRRQVNGWRDAVRALDRLRETLGYKATLNRGYAVMRGDGEVITTRKAAQGAEMLEVEFADGRLELGAGSARPRSAKKPAPPKPEQGSLF